MAGITITLGGNFAFLNQLQAKVAETAAKIKNGFAERVGHRMFDELIATAQRMPEAIKYSIDAASDLGETVSKVGVIFGENKDIIMSWSETSAEALGLAGQEALAAAADYGNLFNAMGLGQAQVTTMSTRMVNLAADLASFNNTSVPEAIQAIGAALRGESEPIRRYGVLLDDATLKAEAMTQGIFDGKGSLEPATRAMAAYSLILEQTSAAQGDFAKTSDGLANSQRTIQAQFENMAATLGTELLPVAEDFANWIKDLDISTASQDIARMISQLSSLASKMAELGMKAARSGPGLDIAFKARLAMDHFLPSSTGPKEESEDRKQAKVAAMEANNARLMEAKATEKAADAYDKAKEKYQQALTQADKARFDALPLEAKIEDLNAAEQKLRETFNSAIKTNFAGTSGEDIAAMIQREQAKGHGSAAGNTESLKIATELMGIEEKRAALLKEQSKTQEEANKKRAAAVAEYDNELTMIRAQVEGNREKVAQLEREAEVRKRIADLTDAGIDPGEAARRAEALVAAGEQLKLAEKQRANKEAMADAESIANGTEGNKMDSNEDFLSKLREIRGKMDGATYQPGITAVDSMQRIGGGGGFAGVDSTIAYQRTQTDLQREMVRLLGDMRDFQNRTPLD
ncbi:hypothetical protein OKA05_02110 [Luteolibacter arcticus]|uniref:Bacteriophage tail tape measure N-terminal domain-containing protein n=1 Tax=Luteolibacter arcticus TaxID=1581411 RepID=A0ABT3GCG3_9BACT|nr:hypothetical protein [Luteolibacter arcticus]MCW1921327.1 hypothetical protein [Luteolibacter arcticus]